MVVSACAAVYHAVQLQVVSRDEVCDEAILSRSGIYSLELFSLPLLWLAVVPVTVTLDNLDHVEIQLCSDQL